MESGVLFRRVVGGKLLDGQAGVLLGCAIRSPMRMGGCLYVELASSGDMADNLETVPSPLCVRTLRCGDDFVGGGVSSGIVAATFRLHRLVVLGRWAAQNI